MTRSGSSNPSNKSKPVKKKSSSSSSAAVGGGGGATMREKILAALVQLRSLNKPTPTRLEVMRMVGHTKWDSFHVLLNSVRKKGEVEYPDSKTVTITQAGIDAAPEGVLEELPSSNEEVQQRVKDKLKISGKLATMFDLMCDGKIHSREEIAKVCGYDETKKDSFRVQLNNLVRKGAAEKVNGSNQSYRLSEMCFLPGFEREEEEG